MSTPASGRSLSLSRAWSYGGGSPVGDKARLEQPLNDDSAGDITGRLAKAFEQRGVVPSRLRTAVGHDSVDDSRSGATVGSWEPFRLAIPGAVSPEGAGWTIEATFATPPSHPADGEPNVAWLDAELLCPPLLVRPRAPGDRFTPSGMRGRQKVHDLLVNTKILRDERDRLPVVLTGDIVVWVGGVRVAEAARWRFDEPPASGRTAVRLELRRRAKTTA